MSELIVIYARRLGVLVTLVFACLLTIDLSALAQKQPATKKTQASQPHVHASAKAAQPEPRRPLAFSIPDIDVVDHEGQKRKFYTDLVKDKVVVINFIFTTCKSFCPLAGANFAKLQTALGGRLGRDVYLISVTTDPKTDSPAKLKAWSAQFNAKSDWKLVTGKPDELEVLLRVLTGDGSNKGYHVPSMVIANDRKKVQRFAYGLESPERVVKMIEELNR